MLHVLIIEGQQFLLIQLKDTHHLREMFLKFHIKDVKKCSVIAFLFKLHELSRNIFIYSFKLMSYR